MSTTNPPHAFTEPVCDACHCAQSEHATELDRIESMDEFPPEEGAAVSTCTDCNDCYVEPPFTGHAGIAAFHPQIQEAIYALKRKESAVRRINGVTHIAQQIANSVPQSTHLVLHAGDNGHVAIHVVLDSTGAGRDTEIQGIYARLQLAGFVHDDEDSADPQAGIAHSSYRHPVTLYRIALVLHGAVDTDPAEYTPLSATTEQVNTIRRDFYKNFFKELSGTPGASS